MTESDFKENGDEVVVDQLREQCLECLNGLRDMIERGEVIAFTAAAITPTDDVRVFVGHSRPVSLLRLEGGMLHALGYLQQMSAGAPRQ